MDFSRYIKSKTYLNLNRAIQQYCGRLVTMEWNGRLGDCTCSALLSWAGWKFLAAWGMTPIWDICLAMLEHLHIGIMFDTSKT
jgi:hypothetical protein